MAWKRDFFFLNDPPRKKNGAFFAWLNVQYIIKAKDVGFMSLVDKYVIIPKNPKVGDIHL